MYRVDPLIVTAVIGIITFGLASVAILAGYDIDGWFDTPGELGLLVTCIIVGIGIILSMKYGSS
jgi:hypothetical protein